MQSPIDKLIQELSEHIIADAFEDGRITDGKLAERLIRERADAAEVLGSIPVSAIAEGAVHGMRVKVKPLEWKSTHTWGGEEWQAETIFRNVTYVVNASREKYFCNFIHGKGFDSADDAKAAAQADYRRRILSAIAGKDE